MEVCLIKRGKVIHCGLVLNDSGKIYKTSICSGVWDCSDKTSVGSSDLVTCKRCRKILATADENGVVDLPKKRVAR